MNKIHKYRKAVSLFFAVLLVLQLGLPLRSYALTSGPAQPEMKGFEPIGTSDMVDLFTGDFTYNIPLLDVGGYPVNLVYHSGANMDEEAGWAGYGWTVSPGSLNRQLRGLPDDFNGNDELARTVNLKDHITKGGSIQASLEALGIPVPKIKLKKKKKEFSLNTTISLGVKFDNYRGVGVDMGLNTGLKLTESAAGHLTKSDDNGNQAAALDTATSGSEINGPNLSLNLSSFDGASLSASQNFSVLKRENDKKEKENVGISLGFGYNTRQGLTGMTMGTSFSKIEAKKETDQAEKAVYRRGSQQLAQSFLSFNGDTYTPTIDNPTTFNSFSFSFSVGPEVFVAFVGLGGTGFYNRQQVDRSERKMPAYGFLHSFKAPGNDPYAVMDFNREKDIPYTKTVNNLPIPVPTYDFFLATSQDGGGQYRAYQGSSGVFFDPRTENKTFNASLGVELGAGTFVDAGVDLYVQDIKTVTQKWKKRNNFLDKGDFFNGTFNAEYEPAYIKRVGEPTPLDNSFFQKIQGVEPVAVHLTKDVAEPLLGAEATAKLRSLSSPNGQSVSSVLKRDRREARNTAFSYLTASQAERHALTINLEDYHPDSIGLGCGSGHIRTSISRTSDYRKTHHMSEVTITADDGKVLKYGIPVYNIKQEEVTFSIGQNHAVRNKGVIRYSSTDNSTSNNQGRENYYSKEVTPAYATSFLLTGILSADYVDLTSNGITDDDLGTAVKFNYTKLQGTYKWRTPYAYGADSANYNEGFLSDARDDKCSYVYGEKEIWYLHSIESKTMVAHFITEDRDDALGVTGTSGAKNTSLKLKRLKEIRLYSKSDLRANGGNPTNTTPIKVVHFEYDYSVCRNLPNSVDGAGKLTLKKVYFTFGQNQKGKLNPYRFSYDTTYYNSYNYRQYDRWGSFKDAAYNPGGLNNSEYPYSEQDSTRAARYASVGQLVEIKLPSGGTIQVTYEADDYGYVQDQRAAIMCQVNGIASLGSSSGLVNADKIFIDLPYPVSTLADMKYRYFQDMSTLYFKFFLDLDNKGHKEFVPGYAKIKSLERINDTTAAITLEKVNGVNPIAKAGWQFIRLNLPKYAYPGSDNYEDQGGDLVKAVKALVTAFGSITELFKGYEKKAKSRGYSNNAEINKSWVRLCAPTLKKKGGGSRVKKIAISDDWATMSATTGAQTATFTQIYNYTTTDSRNNIISSGVASYEPTLGNDENLFRQPIYYSQNQFLGLNSNLYIERPMGESFFPAASVGYSKVIVKSIGSGDAETINRTGQTISEFYTAKDYPTRVEELKLERRKPVSDRIFRLIGGISLEHIGLSQGYLVETNDMHGKPKSVNIYNKSGQNISKVEYFYRSDNELAVRKRLNNNVKLIDTTGTVSSGQIGVETEMYTDMRQQTTDNLGHTIKFSGGVGLIVIIPLPFAFPGYNLNYDRRSYRSSSTIKLVNRFAINYKTVRTENGSSISTENLLWDAETGNVLLTKTQNEFDDPVYSMAYPAHWIYQGMGQAYQNLGTLMTGFTTNSNGTVTNSSYNSLLFPGDELIDINSTAKYWIINSPISGTFAKRLINEAGDIQQISNKTIKLVRSGRRNMANMAVATIVSMENPIKGNKLDVSTSTKVLDAKASVFSEVWAVPVPYTENVIHSTTCEVEEDCMEQFIRASMVINKKWGKAAIYLTESEMYDAQSIVQDIFNSPNEECLEAFIGGQPANQFNFYQYSVEGGPPDPYLLNSGDSAQLGECKLYFDLVTSRFNTIANEEDSVENLVDCTLPPCNYYISVVEDPNVPCGFAVVEEPCPLRHNIEGEEDGCQFETDTIMKFRLSCPDSTLGCLDPVTQKINPYYKGLLGNWRTKSGLVYHIDRSNLVSDNAVKGSTDIRRSGAYSTFNPFWKRNTYWEKNPTNDAKWISANEVTYFNGKGVEIENKDALKRYSSALFGYLESLPTAVASNAEFREIGYDGFEDYGFSLRCTTADTCNPGHFSFRTRLNGSFIDTSSSQAHSGKYSLKLDDSLVTLLKTVTTGPRDSLWSFDAFGRYILGANPLGKGFSPTPGKKYVLSFWVYDGSHRDPTTQVQAIVNGTNLVNNLVKWPIVEKWKRVEVPFVFPSVATSFTLQFRSTTGIVYLDDVRIHPFNGQMKSFCYDAGSQRLMAELDENNFATFYEYDDEGILVRVKKETERGIMTIKETRSSYRKQ